MLSTEWKAVINRMLDAANGDYVIAAKAMEWDTRKLMNAVYNCPELRFRWSGEGKEATLPPNEIDLLSAKVTQIEQYAADFSDESNRMAQAVAAENLKLKKGVSYLGLTDNEAQIALGLQAFHRGLFKESVEMAGAGMTRIGVKLQLEFTVIQDRLTGVRAMFTDMGNLPAEGREILAKEEDQLMRQLLGISQEARKVTEVGFKGAYMLAMAQLKKQGMNGGKLRKPGFSQEPIDIEPKEPLDQ